MTGKIRAFAAAGPLALDGCGDEGEAGGSGVARLSPARDVWNRDIGARNGRAFRLASAREGRNRAEIVVQTRGIHAHLGSEHCLCTFPSNTGLHDTWLT